jgi:voltage-gated potassium channel
LGVVVQREDNVQDFAINNLKVSQFMPLLTEFRKAVHWLQSLGQEVVHRRSVRYLLLLAGGAVISFGFLIYLVDPNIHSPLAGMWYAWVTMTHVGYGDLVTSSFLGRTLSAVLILLGVGFFALAAGIFASILVAEEMRGVSQEVDEMEQDMEHIESAETRILVELHTITRRLTAIEAQLDKPQPAPRSRTKDST